MCQLFDLLQGHVERWDGFWDQTLGRMKTSEMRRETLCVAVRPMCPCALPPGTDLGRCVGRRSPQRGVGRGVGRRRTD